MGDNIDVVLLACTHYPLMLKQIQEYIPVQVKLLSQGEIVAQSLADYLNRHPEIDAICSKSGRLSFFTTDSTADFDKYGAVFFGNALKSAHVQL